MSRPSPPLMVASRDCSLFADNNNGDHCPSTEREPISEVAVDEDDLDIDDLDDFDQAKTDEEEDEDDDEEDEDEEEKEKGLVTSSPAEPKPSKEASKRTNESKKKTSKSSRVAVELREEDLEEKFVRGSGPGGQAVNKTSNCVQLRHIPTGIIVHCHETRERAANRKIARRRMRDQLDLLLNGDASKIKQREKRAQRRKSKAAQRAKKKYGDKEEVVDKVDNSRNLCSTELVEDSK